MDKKLIANEIDELQRVVQDLKRDEDIDISLGKLVTAFSKSKEVKLTDDIWDNLENTESNEIVKGDLDSVKSLAKRYGKTNPDVLVKAIKSNEYHRPLIVKFDGGRYHLVAGNTRLCTAKAMGVTPKVFIADLSEKKQDVDEDCWKGYKQVGGKIKNGKQVPNCVPKNESEGDTNEAANAAQQAAIAINMKKKGIEPKEEETKEQTMAGSSGQYSAPLFGTIKKELREEILSTGEYDVPAFGKTSKGGRKNPLKIDGVDSIYKGRAVKDKDFPKWGGPDSVFIKIKEKCKKFPYCNQGDINAIEIVKETEGLKESIIETSKKYGIPYKEMENIVLNEINKIFI